MSPDHAELQLDIPDYARGTIDLLRRQRLEAHLATCRECEDLVIAAAAIAARARGGSDPWDGPHPPTSLLLRFGREAEGVLGEAIRRHLAGCETCAVEHQVLGRRSIATSGSLKPARPAHEGRRLILAATGGLAFGLLLGLVGPAAVRQPAPQPTWRGGAAPLLLLEDAARGSESVAKLDRSPGQSFVPVGVRLRSVEPGLQYEFRILDPSGREIWSTMLTSEAVESQVKRSWIVSFLVPGEALRPGRHTLRVDSTGPSGSTPVLEAGFEVER